MSVFVRFPFPAFTAPPERETGNALQQPAHVCPDEEVPFGRDGKAEAYVRRAGAIRRAIAPISYGYSCGCSSKR